MNNSVDRLSYLQPAEYEYSSVDHTFNPVKNLNDLFVAIEDCDNENLRVYLRVRPSLPDENVHSEEFHVDLLDNRSVVLTAPASSNTFKNASHGIAKLSQKFTFSHIYGPSTSQKELFEESTLGLVNDFVAGQNILLFTYGATNSGKTFTVQGSPTDPGILPRTLDILFRSIGDKHYPRNDLKPRYFCDISRLEEKDVKKEEEKKQNIFKISSENLSRFSISMSNISKLSSEISLNETQPSSVNTSGISSVIEVPCQEDVSIELADSENTVYAVFVSYVEIYNEYVYDLLEQMPLCKKKKRNPLMLGEDRNASIYIKGLQEVRVNSAEEAWQILEIGRQNLHFAATRLNHNSSRSHCIFTVKVVRLADARDPHVARVSMMSICDLAGAERAAKTKSNQDRLKEAGNINSSLLVLSRCLDALRQNQIQKGSKKREVPVPYRDSKLTRLFQSFFLGRGKAAMIVNISRSPLMFDETLQVLKFSAIAKQVAISHSKEPECQVTIPKRPSQFSKFVRQSLNTSGRLSVPWMKDTGNMTFGDSGKKEDSLVILEEEKDEEEEEEEDERYEALLKLIGQLRDKLVQEHKEKVELEDRLRDELCNEFSQQLVEIENSWSQRLKEQQSRMEEFSECRISALMNSVKKTNGRKRLRPDNDPDEEYVPSIHLFQEQQKNKEQALQIDELKMESNHLKEEMEAMKVSQKKTNEQASRAQEENSKLTFQLAQLTRCLENTEKDLEDARKTITSTTSEDQEIKDLQRRLQDIQSQMELKDSEIKDFKAMIVEAAEEFIIKKEEIESFTKALEQKEKTITKQLMTMNELESQLSETREILSQHAVQLEERDQHISELQEQLATVQNVEDVASEMKKLRSIAESYQTQVLILEQNLTATEKERNKAEKELEGVKIKKRQIEEDFLRDKSKLLLELAGLKRNGVKDMKLDESGDLREALSKVTQLEEEAATLRKEKSHLQNQLTESKDLFEHLQKTNSQQESYHRSLIKEKDDMKRDLDELSMKLMSLQDERAAEQLDTSSLKASNVSVTNQVNMLKNKLQDNAELIGTLNEKLIVQKTVSESVQLENEKLEKLNEELIQKVNNMKSCMDNTADIKLLEEKLKSSAKELAKLEEDLKKEKEVNALLKEKEELLHKTEEEKESAINEVNRERKKSADTVDTLTSEVTNLKVELENAKCSLKEKEEQELDLKKFLDAKEAELEENVSALNKKESEVTLLEQKLTEKKEEMNKLEKLGVDLENERKCREQSESKKQELSDLLSSTTSELEKCKCERESLRNNLEKLQEVLTKCEKKDSEGLEKLTEENKSLIKKMSDLEEVVDTIKEEKRQLESELQTAEKQLEEIKSVEVHLRSQVLDVKEAEAQVKEEKLSSQQELLTCKGDLLEVRASVATLKGENSLLREKIESSSKVQEELSIKVRDKEEVILSLNAKIESLDRKLNRAEEDLENRGKSLKEELEAERNKCDLLEKEVRAVREARQEEVNQFSHQFEEQEEKLKEKDTEVSTLQQEVKKLLQQSMTSSMCNLSHNTTSETPVLKKECNDRKSILGLKEEVRLSEAKNETLLKEVTDLRSQLEKMTLTYSSLKATPAKSSQKKALQPNQSENVVSDVESVSIVTPTPRKRSTRKTRTPANTPIEAPVQLDSTTEDFAPPIKINSVARNTQSSRPQRNSRRIQKIDTSFEYENFEKSFPKSTRVEDEEEDEECWMPPVVEKKPARGGRKGRGRKPKTLQVFNPHLNNQENKNILANCSQESLSGEDFKTPHEKSKRHLFKSVNDELYMGSPIMDEVPRKEDSPHSVVRRQLRNKRK